MGAYVCTSTCKPTHAHTHSDLKSDEPNHCHRHTNSHLCTHNMVCIYMYIAICMYMWLHICICIYTYMCIYLYVYSYKSVYTHMRGHRICLNHRSRNTGFGLRVFLALSNKSVFVLSMTCSSKTLRTIWLVTFSARLTWSRHICSTLHHIFGCLLFLKFG